MKFGLRFAAKPLIETKLRSGPALKESTPSGDSPRRTAHAFSSLRGAGTVSEALETLKRSRW
jgi:hypothetical protein